MNFLTDTTAATSGSFIVGFRWSFPGNLINFTYFCLVRLTVKPSKKSILVVAAEYEAILFGKQFHAGEKYLEASGLKWTHLRTIFFQENFHGWADGIKQGGLYFGIPEGQFAPLNVADIGEMSANILTTDGHEGKAYNVTGPELLSGQLMADIFTKVTGKAVAYVSPSTEDTLDFLLSTGWPEWQAKGMLELFEVFATNQAAMVSPDGEMLLGRPMTKMKDYIAANKAAFI